MLKKKRKSTKEIIEEDEQPDREYTGVKFPGGELIDISDFRGHLRNTTDYDKLRKEWLKRGKRKYTNVHTHPTEINRKIDNPNGWDLNFAEELSAIPSEGDLTFFLRDDQEKSAVIAPRETDTGKIRGYLVIHKTRQTPHYYGSPVKPSFNHFIDSIIFNPIRKYMGIDPFKNSDWSQKDNSKVKKEMRKRMEEYKFELERAYKSKNAELARKAFDKLSQDFHSLRKETLTGFSL